MHLVKMGLFVRPTALFLALMLLSGCASLQKNDAQGSASTLLEPQAVLRFADIPVPAGFKIVAKESYSFENAGTRVAVLKYQGKVDADRVVSFYKDQLPMYNWNLVNVIEYNERLMNFDRDSESCIVSVFPKGSSSTIIISLGPKSQLPPKKQNKPLK